MGRKKIEFTEEQNELLKSLSSSGKKLEEIVTLFNDEYGTEYAYSTIFKQIKTIGIDRKDNRMNNTKKPVHSNLNRSELVKLLASHTPNQVIAKTMNTDIKSVENAIRRYKITYSDMKKYNDEEFVKDLQSFDMRSLKREVFETMWREISNDAYLKSKGIEVIPNAVIEVDGTQLTVDFYIPMLMRGYVCSTYDPSITEKGDHLCMVRKTVRLINKRCKVKRDGCKLSYEGLYIDLYEMMGSFEERRCDVERTAKKIIGDIISIASNGYRDVIRINIPDSEIEDYEERKGLKEEVRKSYKPTSVYDEFNHMLKKVEKEARRKLREDPEYLDKLYGLPRY